MSVTSGGVQKKQYWLLEEYCVLTLDVGRASLLMKTAAGWSV